ncbi:hypothetical protein Trco_003029 [Trichoderma cornu-damae]|uniref:Uncharacterized protein n=1 Tax=Trichoderma cornu-damae TaxID=654480 RepID=A0A9P8TYK1_9HYPO|nr:hypothetical protein Trco_003029 [Trichoderma cornu-damae]
MKFQLFSDPGQGQLQNLADGGIRGAVGALPGNLEGLGNSGVLLGLVLLGGSGLGGVVVMGVTAGTHAGEAQRDLGLAVRHGADGGMAEVLLELDLGRIDRQHCT